jgi:hypothetical protein
MNNTDICFIFVAEREGVKGNGSVKELSADVLNRKSV